VNTAPRRWTADPAILGRLGSMPPNCDCYWMAGPLRMQLPRAAAYCWWSRQEALRGSVCSVREASMSTRTVLGPRRPCYWKPEPGSISSQSQEWLLWALGRRWPFLRLSCPGSPTGVHRSA